MELVKTIAMHSNINVVLQIHISQTGSGWLLVLFMLVRVYPRAIKKKKNYAVI